VFAERFREIHTLLQKHLARGGFRGMIFFMGTAVFDGYCSTVQGLLDWFEVDLGFTELSFIQIDLCVLCVLEV